MLFKIPVEKIRLVVIALVAVIATSTNVSAQGQENIEWGEFQDVKSDLLKVYPTGNGTFYTIRGTSSVGVSNYEIHYSNGKELVKNAITPTIGIYEFVDAFMYKNNLAVFYTERGKDQYNLRVDFYDSTMSKAQPSILLEQRTAAKGTASMSCHYRVVQSYNEKYFAVIALEKEINKNYSIYDEHFQLIESEASEITDLNGVSYDGNNEFFVSNSGELFVSKRVIGKSNGIQSYSDLTFFSVYKIRQGIQIPVDLELVSDNAKGIIFRNLENNQILIAGLYGKPQTGVAKGIFYQIVDSETDQKITNKLYPFNDSIYGITDVSTKITDLKENEKPGLKMLVLRELFFLSDGSILPFIEGVFSVGGPLLQQSPNHRSPGSASHIIKINYDPASAFRSNIGYFVYKINKEDNVEWVNHWNVGGGHLPINDPATYFYIKLENTFEVIFADDVYPYNKNEEYRRGLPSKGYLSVKEPKYLALAKQTINLSDGKSSRSAIVIDEEIDGYCKGGFCTTNLERTKLIIVAQNKKKEKYGTLSIK